MINPKLQRSSYLVKTLLLCALGLLLLFLLKGMVYSTGIIENISDDNLTNVPSPNFTIGSMKWDVSSYKYDPKLEVYREYFKKHCKGKTGVSAALCISRALTKNMPWGIPFDEFYNPSIDPIKSFSKYIAGSPGHCVTRSGYMSAILLSAGIPARVVCLIDDKISFYHTVIEVWEKEYGWVLIDPSFNVVVGQIKSSDPVCLDTSWLYSDRWAEVSYENTAPLENPHKYYQDVSKKFKGGIIYPEPWSYLRTGKRYSGWPFRTRFIAVGSLRWQFGPGQTLLRLGILACAIGAILFLIIAMKK